MTNDILAQAVYINIPFCASLCSFCHYVDNINFGYKAVPAEYFATLVSQLEDLLSRLKLKKLASIYFGGGTPSLLSNAQVDIIRKVFDNADISADEVSIEINPAFCNFNYSQNDYFTRYSIGVQSFNWGRLREYNRVNYSFDTISGMISAIRNSNPSAYINVDLLFKLSIIRQDVIDTVSLQPDSITIYPDSRIKGKDRLLTIYSELESIIELLASYGYVTVLHLRHIFVRYKDCVSRYQKIQYELFGNIYGVGNNAISHIGNSSYLSVYNNGSYLLKPKSSDRYNMAFIESLPFGVLNKFSFVCSDYLLKIDNRRIGSNHAFVSDDDMVYLPEYEYVRFADYLRDNFGYYYFILFLRSVMYGDDCIKTFRDIFGVRMEHTLKTQLRCKHKAPIKPMFILIEGIDGSGKDTFADFLIFELKKRFMYDEHISISVTGQPLSSLKSGPEAKKFIEHIDFSDKTYVERILTENRVAFEEKHKNQFIICIRGIATDLGTFKAAFGELPSSDLGQNTNIDMLIVVDTDYVTASNRIANRGMERQWRETDEYLCYFRDFFLEFNHIKVKEKIIVNNISLEVLRQCAVGIANKIFFACESHENIST